MCEAFGVYTYLLQPLIWFRLIDDIFQIWTHGIEEFKKSKHHLNYSVELIRFQIDTSLESVHFLDVTVSINNGGEIKTSLYISRQQTHITTRVITHITQETVEMPFCTASFLGTGGSVMTQMTLFFI